MQAFVRAFFRIILRQVVRILYGPRILHADRVPPDGGVLLISNHVTYIDAFLIHAASPRPVRFVVVSDFMNLKAIGWFMKLFGAIPIRPGHVRDAIRKTAEALRAGEVVCVFPEGQLSRIGVLLEMKKGFEVIARQSGAQVVPMYVDGSWKSVFSYERDRYFWKIPRHFRLPVTAIFGEAIPPEQATVDRARAAIFELSAEAFSARRAFDQTLDMAAVRALKKNRRRLCFVEHGKRTRKFRRSQILAMAIALADRWKQSLPEDEQRIGILLPPGWTPGLINLTLVFSGRIPVNLPLSFEDFDSEKLAVALKNLKIRTVITARAFAGQLAEFPWKNEEGGQFVDMGAELGAISLVRMLGERLLAWIEPARVTGWRLGLKKQSEVNEEAFGFLPCSAESGRPVFLTHQEVIAGVARLSAGNFVNPKERIFSELPIYSAAGAAFSLWVPILQGATGSSRSFAIRSVPEQIESVLQEEGVTLMVADRNSLDQLAGLEEEWHPEVRQQVRAIFAFLDSDDSTGSDDRLDPVESRTGTGVFRGWAPDFPGLVLSLSVPDPETKSVRDEAQAGSRDGSVGRLLPGISPEIGGGAQGDFSEEGPLRLKGLCFDRGDHGVTGRNARIDADGFVFLSPENSS